MYETMYVIVAAIGSVALLFAIGLYRWHDEVELFAVISLGSWGTLALESSNLVVLTANGAESTYGSFPMQLLCLGLALVSLFAIYGAKWGDWLDGKSETEAPV